MVTTTTKLAEYARDREIRRLDPALWIDCVDTLLDQLLRERDIARHAQVVAKIAGA